MILKSLNQLSICSIQVGNISNLFLSYLKFISPGKLQLKGFLVLLSVTFILKFPVFPNSIVHHKFKSFTSTL